MKKCLILFVFILLLGTAVVVYAADIVNVDYTNGNVTVWVEATQSMGSAQFGTKIPVDGASAFYTVYNGNTISNMRGSVDGTDAGQIELQTRDQSGNYETRLIVKNDGKVGIGTTNPTEKLYVSGNIYATGAITQYSSREAKEGIVNISTTEAMEALKGLNPVRFKYKTDPSKEEYLGFIAEDVPDLVTSKAHNRLSALSLTALLTKVVQEQQEAIQKQQKMIEEQQKIIISHSHMLEKNREN